MFNMDLSYNILKKIDEMDYIDRKELIQRKSKYGTYIFKFDNNAQKDYYKYMLDKFKLYKNDYTSTFSDNGYFFYSPRSLIKKDGSKKPDFAIYSSDNSFIDDDNFIRMYNMEDVNTNIIQNNEFDGWLKKFIIDIFGVDSKSMYSPRKFVYENMKKVKKFNDFLNEKKIPKISINIKDLLSILEGNKIDIFRKFRINKDAVGVRDNIDELYVNRDFNINFKKDKLKKGKLQNTQYSETLLDDKYILKFFFLYEQDSMELEEPGFIILQYYNTDNTERSDILGFENTDNINSFYEMLTDATIELTKGDDTYIYQTTNGGNNWQMKNVQLEDDEMKGALDKKELQDLIDKKNFKVSNE